MNPFFSVRFRLFALCIGLLAVMGGANLLLGEIIREREPQEVEQQAQYQRVETIQAVHHAVNDYRFWQGQVNTALLLRNKAWQVQAEEGFAGVQRTLFARLGEMEEFDPRAVADIKEVIAALPSETRSAVEALVAGRQSDADAHYVKVRQRIVTIQDALKVALDREQSGAAEVQRQERLRASNAVSSSILILGVSAATGLLLTLLVLRSIIGPLRSTVSVIRMVNAGETSVDLPPVSQDEFGDIAQALR
jgi:ElaB/YqjD/DUF883 family membrane-anchored ribosome-binding protein